MEFRPCIDIHDGAVKQIVGGSLSDSGLAVKENFVSQVDASFYANLYKDNNIHGGHVILLNAMSSPMYEATKSQALLALRSYPGGLQVGGGINPDNAKEYLDAGASHVIVTSYVFKDGQINREALNKMVNTVGVKSLVLDLSVRSRDGKYMIVTDRWQKFTDVELTLDTIEDLSKSCDEFLIHAVDVEGKASGIETQLVELLGKWDGNPITYAGGIHSFDALRQVKELGQDRINATIGSALDLFGGDMKFAEVIKYINQ